MTTNRWHVDGKTVFAVILVVGFMILLGIGMFVKVPATNSEMVKAGLASLGTAVGAAVMALLRTDANERVKAETDAARADNTGKALDAIGTALNSTPNKDVQP